MLLALAAPSVVAPEYRSYPPSSVTVTTGTGAGTVDDLYSVDALVYSVLEEDVGADSTLTATEEWIVVGTLSAGAFPGDMQTQDGTGVVYQEADDDNGALTGDSVLLTPTGVGTYTEWDGVNPGLTPHWQVVDDDPPHDGDATYVVTPTNSDVDTYEMEDLGVFGPGLKESGTVTTFGWCLCEGLPRTGIIYSDVYVGGNLYQGLPAPADCGVGYTNNTYQWAENPADSEEWEYADINAMEVGMTSSLATDTIRVTSVGAVIPTQDLNYVLDVRHNVTAVPAGREYYLLTMRARIDSIPAETITVSVYDHVAVGWDVMFTFDANAYATETFDLVEADHVNTGEVWVRSTDAAGDALGPDMFNIDLLNVRAWSVEYTLDVSFNWVGLESQRDPRLAVVGYKSDAELMTLQVLRRGAWVALDANIFVAGVTASWAFTLAPVDVEGGTLEVRFVDNDDTDNAASTIYLDLLTVRVEMEEQNPAAPIDVYVDVSYDLWANEIVLRVRWVQTGGPEPAVETGKWATVWADDVEVGTYTIGDGARRVAAPWSFFDGGDHNVTAVGAVNVIWPTWGGDQTYFSDPDLERVSNFPRFAVLMFGLLCLLAVVAVVAVRAIREKRGEDEKGP